MNDATRSGARDGIRLAVGTLTAWPVPAPGRLDRRAARTAMLLAPLVGLGVGAAAGAVAGAAVALGLAGLPAAALALAVAAWATRGLHLDGLADTADGLAASYDRQRALAVMRRGDVGPLGAVTCALTLLVQAGAAAQVLAEHGPGGGGVQIALALAAARLALPVACRAGVPAARADGLGAAVAGAVPTGAAVTACLAAIAALAGLRLATTPPSTASAQDAALVAVLTVLAVATLTGVLVRRAVTRLGGVTGDVLGAAVELSAAGALVVLAAG